MNKEDIKFKIDQLRKDKIIYGVEAIATNLAVILIVILMGVLSVNFPFSQIVIGGSVVIGVGYTLYMGVGNFYRLKKVKELEKKLN